METKRANVAVLLVLIGVVLMLGAGNVKVVNAQICPQICYTDAAYMTCPSTGSRHLAPKCSCCIAGRGCHLYRANGSKIC